MAGSPEQKAFIEYLQALTDKVEEDVAERHDAGAQKYGSLKFLGADTLQEAYEEVLDLINYARYTAIKLLLLQGHLAEKAAPLAQEGTTGGFIPTSELQKKVFKPE
jgi:tryptophanyl-tRNA synthetase